MWQAMDNGLTIETIGSENGKIIKDEESILGARVTIEKDGHIAPFSITCGIYGLFVHTAFCSNLVETNQKYDEIKDEIQKFLLTESLSENDIADWCSRFSSKY